jgi:hypothetical protein
MQFAGTLRVMHMQFVGMGVVCMSEHQGFKKAKENMGQCKSGVKGFKREYAKEQIRENMGQSESKERGLKEQKRRL